MTCASEVQNTAFSKSALPGEAVGVGETLRTIAAGFFLALLLRVVAYQPFTIPSASMEPGLVTGDYILVAKYSYGWSRASLPFNPPLASGRLFRRDPARGDVVVFRASDNPSKTLIKRVVGLPGDRVQLKGGVVVLNGRALDARGLGLGPDDSGVPVMRAAEHAPGGRTYQTFDRGEGREGDDTGVFLVPADRLFVLGDNRDNSLDSRWPTAAGGVGLVPVETLVGKAELVLLSWRPGASLFKPWTWLSLRGDRFARPIR